MIGTIENNNELVGEIGIATIEHATDVQINETSITSNNVANIATEGTYDASTNKITTKSYVDNLFNSITDGDGVSY